MKPALRLGLALSALAFAAGCQTRPSGALQILEPAEAKGAKLAVASDFHLATPEAEDRLAAELREALRRRGFTVVNDATRADLVVLPTLGRVKQDSAAAAPTPLVPAADLARGSLTASRLRREHAASAAPATPQQEVGLLLTAVRSGDYVALGGQRLRPVWRIYVATPVKEVSWESSAVPLVRAASSAAAPLAQAPKPDR
jgi:hypothetical protein